MDKSKNHFPQPSEEICEREKTHTEYFAALSEFGTYQQVGEQNPPVWKLCLDPLQLGVEGNLMCFHKDGKYKSFYTHTTDHVMDKILNSREEFDTSHLNAQNPQALLAHHGLHIYIQFKEWERTKQDMDIQNAKSEYSYKIQNITPVE